MSDMDIRETLDAEVLRELKSLETLEPGSKEEQMAIDNVAKLYRLRLDDDRTGIDYEEKAQRRKMEEDRDLYEREKQERDEEIRNQQALEQRIWQGLRIGLDAAGIILPLVFYATWMKRGFKFEETGTFTSTTFRGLFNRFRPTAK